MTMLCSLMTRLLLLTAVTLALGACVSHYQPDEAYFIGEDPGTGVYLAGDDPLWSGATPNRGFYGNPYAGFYAPWSGIYYVHGFPYAHHHHPYPYYSWYTPWYGHRPVYGPYHGTPWARHTPLRPVYHDPERPDLGPAEIPATQPLSTFDLTGGAGTRIGGSPPQSYEDRRFDRRGAGEGGRLVPGTPVPGTSTPGVFLSPAGGAAAVSLSDLFPANAERPATTARSKGIQRGTQPGGSYRQPAARSNHGSRSNSGSSRAMPRSASRPSRSLSRASSPASRSPAPRSKTLQD